MQQILGQIPLREKFCRTKKENQYLEIVNYYCLKFNISNDKNFINNKALQWSLNRGAKSGREAYHFVKSLHNKKI